MSDAAWTEARDLLRESRQRCFAAVAAAIGCRPEQLPAAVQRAIAVFGHGCYQVALQYAHERDTVPAPRLTPAPDLPPPAGSGSVGAYHEMPATRVDTVHAKKKAR